MEDAIIKVYKESMASMFGVSDTWRSLYMWQVKRAEDLEQSRDYWREKCEFYEKLIKGEAV